MKVILKDDVKNVGNMGDIVKVTDGYARNYLVPKGLAVEASSKNVKSVEHEKRIIQEKAKKIRNSAEDLSDRISKVTLVVKVKSHGVVQIQKMIHSIAEIVGLIVLICTAKLGVRVVAVVEYKTMIAASTQFRKVS